MIRGRIALVIALALALARPVRAGANPTPTESVSPRSVGRAGIGAVSEDSGLAVLINPAGLARRGQPRLVLGLRLAEIDTEIDSARVGGEPRVTDQASPAVFGAIGYAQGLGERLVVAASVLETSDHQRAYGTPLFGQVADVERLFPARYAGLTASTQTQTAAAGAAFRASDWLAIGVGLSGSRRTYSSSRSVWAGFSGRDVIGAPERDLTFRVEADKLMIPGAQLGVLVAPARLPIELAIAVTAVSPHVLAGVAGLRPTNANGTPPDPGPDVDAELKVPGEVTSRAGVRYLGRRMTAEVGGVATFYWNRKKTASWRVDDLGVIDESGASATITEMPALLRARQQFAVGGALDVALVEGFLWVTTGYAYRSAGVSPTTRNPLLVSPTGHRLAVGLEAVWSQFAITLGFAHELSPAVVVPDTGGMNLFNPFDAGTAPAAAGRYEHQASHGALTVEFAFE